MIAWWSKWMKWYEANLKVEKKYHKYIDIYHIGYITIKQIVDYENIHSVNPLYLIIHSRTGYFTKENDTWFLIQQINMKKFGLELEQKSKELMVENNFFMKKTTLELKLILMMIYHWIKH